MNCFNHPDIVAVGTCRACSKGLCHQCAVDLGHGLSCKGEHESMVQFYNELAKRNQRAIAAAPKNILIGPLFFAFMGVVFFVWGLTSPTGRLDFAVILGAGFVVYALAIYLRARKALARQA